MTLDQILKKLKEADFKVAFAMGSETFFVETTDPDGDSEDNAFDTLKEAKDWLEEKIPT